MWQDREIRFDVPIAQLNCRPGESVIDSLSQVEDTKGNSGQQGNLIVTNIRMIWFAEKNQRINLTVGYDCILTSELKDSSSAVKGNTFSL